MSKIYGGNAKIIQTKFGTMTKISQSRTDLEKLLAYLNSNDTEWVNLVMKEKQEKVEGKATHYLEVDDWKPVQVANKPTEKRIVENDNLPF
jgi:RNA binding exosome subunit